MPARLRAPAERGFDGTYCVDAHECVRAREALGLAREAGCFYGDLSTAERGILPAVDGCEERPHEDLCGEGCPCALGRCELASEMHPWGACQYAIPAAGCRASASCDLGACMVIRAPPAVAELWPRWAEEHVCTRPEICAALSALYPDTYACLE